MAWRVVSGVKRVTMRGDIAFGGRARMEDDAAKGGAVEGGGQQAEDEGQAAAIRLWRHVVSRGNAIGPAPAHPAPTGRMDEGLGIPHPEGRL